MKIFSNYFLLILILFSLLSCGKKSNLVLPLNNINDNIFLEVLKSSSNSADYIIISSSKYEDEIVPLIHHRQMQGLRTVVVDIKKIYSEFGDGTISTKAIRDFLRYSYTNWQPPQVRYVLLIGDVPKNESDFDGIPIEIVQLSKKKICSSDNWYALMDDNDHIPDIAIGRLSVDSEEDVKNIIQKIINYETNLPGGEWRKNITLFASLFGMGPDIENFLVKMFTLIYEETIPASMDQTMTYGNPDSPFFYIPSEFTKNILEKMNNGSLIMSYTGHGSEDGTHVVEWENKSYPILNKTHLSQINVQNKFPIMFFIACEIGNIDYNSYDSFAEELLRLPQGAIAIVSATRVSDFGNPYILGYSLNSILKKKIKRLGDALKDAKNDVLNDRSLKFRQWLDSQFIGWFGQEELDNILNYHLHMYNLLGDPALKVPLLEENIHFLSYYNDENLSIAGLVPAINSGNITVSLECNKTQFCYPIKSIKGLTGSEATETIRTNYYNANNKVIYSTTTEVKNGLFMAELPLGDDLETGNYIIKGYASDNIYSFIGSKNFLYNKSINKKIAAF